jgi:hypothetical protein
MFHFSISQQQSAPIPQVQKATEYLKGKFIQANCYDSYRKIDQGVFLC